jgi:hypothetical protein
MKRITELAPADEAAIVEDLCEAIDLVREYITTEATRRHCNEENQNRLANFSEGPPGPCFGCGSAQRVRLLPRSPSELAGVPVLLPLCRTRRPIMNSLRYTNAMLTIIALAFSVIIVENFIRPSAAQSTQIQPVAICDIISRTCLDVERTAQGSLVNVRVVRQ